VVFVYYFTDNHIVINKWKDIKFENINDNQKVVADILLKVEIIKPKINAISHTIKNELI
jgi:hypothetical protein